MKFPPVPINVKNGRITFTVTSGPRVLALVAEPGACHYSGSTTTLAVTVTLDSRIYKGCGRALAPEQK